MENYFFIDGNVTSPLGFTANGVSAGVKAYTNAAAGIADEPIEGVKNGKRDLAMIYCEKQCNAAAIFTKNLVKSDTIYVTQKHLANGKAQAVIVNSGNANACNPDGYDKAEAMCRLAAVALGVAEDDVIVASTGVIGQALPIEPIQKGVEELKGILSRDGGTNAAEAIMTTDTVKKQWAVQHNRRNRQGQRNDTHQYGHNPVVCHHRRGNFGGNVKIRTCRSRRCEL